MTRQTNRIVHSIEEAEQIQWPNLDLVAGIAHDLRTPLATITTSAELLEQELDSEVSGHLVGVIQRQVKHLQSMIEDLSEYVGIQSGNLVLHPRTIDLKELVQEVCSDFQEFHSSHSIVVRLPARAVRIPGDHDKLRRLLENLLRNAFNYSPRGSTVFASLILKGSGKIRIEVEDQGPGVPEESRARIFEPFVRLNPSRSTGQGLGLHLVKLFTSIHQGRVWVEDGQQGGARFCIELPTNPTYKLPAGSSDPA